MSAARKEIATIARFGVIGILATVVHAVCYLALSETAGLNALYANWIGFSVAFAVSLVGHSRWTFNTELTSRRATRFLITAAIGLAANTGFVYVIVEMLEFRPAVVLPFIMFVTPALIYVVSKFWAFA